MFIASRPRRLMTRCQRVRIENALWIRLVELQPERADLLDRFHKFTEVHGLEYVSIRAQLVAARYVTSIARRTEHDDRNRFQLRIGLDLLQHAEAVQLG